MEFILGIITGLVLATFVAATLVFFRRPIEHKLAIVEKQIANKGPRPKGHVFAPTDEATEAREKIIEENRKQGKDTKLSELS